MDNMSGNADAIASDKLGFNLDIKPFWHGSNQNLPQLRQMLTEIFENVDKVTKTSEDHKKRFKLEALKKIIFYTCIGENEGTHKRIEIDRVCTYLQNPEASLLQSMRTEERISYQIGQAVIALDKFYENNKARVLTVDGIQNVHRILMCKLIPQGRTQPGLLRTGPAFTNYDDETVNYTEPLNIDSQLASLCDYYCLCMSYISKKEGLQRLQYLFKCASWFIVNFLKIHPFSDGNGRTARLLGSYILQFVLPMYTSIYNVCSVSRKDYVQAIRIGQQQDDTSATPAFLAVMMIESCWSLLREHIQTSANE